MQNYKGDLGLAEFMRRLQTTQNSQAERKETLGY